jgi:energy-coupling factor transporter ATP-binding protein EcfA2
MDQKEATTKSLRMVRGSATGKQYTASLSKNQGRAGYSIIFRHPVRCDEATGKSGVRVRRGLGTRDETEANRLRSQLNELLGDARYHEASARAEAERRFDPVVVDIFFYKLVPEQINYRTIREAAIPLPDSQHDDYRRVLLLGTTGAGKTTLARQFIGTNPTTERFPSTSTAKTTIHDTEIIVADGPWSAIVTFASSDEIREYLTECLSAATLAAKRKESDAEILRRILNHVNQRFRFSYVLGNGPLRQVSDFDDDEEDGDSSSDDLMEGEGAQTLDMSVTNELLARSVTAIKEIAARHAKDLCETLVASSETDNRVIDELFEEELDNLVRDDEQFHAIADELLDEIERRFELLDPAAISRTRQGWPLTWTWESDDRRAFLRAVSRFSSNHAKFFGQLLTPLVNGLRVSGPFAPEWSNGVQPKLVLLDGEGLGHSPKTMTAISTSVTRQIEEVDAVLLVDNATQPMQAAPVAAMRELVSSGNGSKLILAFTHFDEVKGDNLLTSSAKVQHVMASAENVLAAFGEDLGPFAERALRKRMETARVFLEGIDKPLTSETKPGARAISQITKLLRLIDEVVETPKPADSRPTYDRMNLVLAIRRAAENFHDAWFPRLGLEVRSGGGKEHWTRVKALSRRLATGMSDHYDTLHPVADLKRELQDRIYVFVQNPLNWRGPEPNDDDKQVIFDGLAESIAKRMLILSTERVWTGKATEWQSAYNKRGQGSTFDRAVIIGNQIFGPAAPIPDVTPSVDRNQFLREVATEVQEAADEWGAELV